MNARDDQLQISLHLAERGWKQAIDLLKSLQIENHDPNSTATTSTATGSTIIHGASSRNQFVASDPTIKKEMKVPHEWRLEVESLRYDNDRLQRQAIDLEQRMSRQMKQVANEVNRLLESSLPLIVSYQRYLPYYSLAADLSLVNDQDDPSNSFSHLMHQIRFLASRLQHVDIDQLVDLVRYEANLVKPTSIPSEVGLTSSSTSVLDASDRKPSLPFQTSILGHYKDPDDSSAALRARDAADEIFLRSSPTSPSSSKTSRASTILSPRSKGPALSPRAASRTDSISYRTLASETDPSTMQTSSRFIFPFEDTYEDPSSAQPQSMSSLGRSMSADSFSRQRSPPLSPSNSTKRSSPRSQAAVLNTTTSPTSSLSNTTRRSSPRSQAVVLNTTTSPTSISGNSTIRSASPRSQAAVLNTTTSPTSSLSNTTRRSSPRSQAVVLNTTTSPTSISGNSTIRSASPRSQLRTTSSPTSILTAGSKYQRSELAADEQRSQASERGSSRPKSQKSRPSSPTSISTNSTKRSSPRSQLQATTSPTSISLSGSKYQGSVATVDDRMSQGSSQGSPSSRRQQRQSRTTSPTSISSSRSKYHQSDAATGDDRMSQASARASASSHLQQQPTTASLSSDSYETIYSAVSPTLVSHPITAPTHPSHWGMVDQYQPAEYDQRTESSLGRRKRSPKKVTSQLSSKTKIRKRKQALDIAPPNEDPPTWRYPPRLSLAQRNSKAFMKELSSLIDLSTARAGISSSRAAESRVLTTSPSSSIASAKSSRRSISDTDRSFSSISMKPMTRMRRSRAAADTSYSL
jgi:trimeric autotransporter adhesin